MQHHPTQAGSSPTQQASWALAQMCLLLAASLHAPANNYTNVPGSHLGNIHAEENVVLGTHAQTLPDGTQLSPDVSVKDEGSAGGWRKETGQNGPADRGA